MLLESKFGQVYSYIGYDAILTLRFMQILLQLDSITLAILDFEFYTSFSIYDQKNKSSSSPVWLLTKNSDLVVVYHFRVLNSLNFWLLNIL